MTPRERQLVAATPHLSSRYTFDSFVVGDCNRLAHAAALEVVQSPGKTYNPLFIYGGAGLGKTHLVQAIGHKAREANCGVVYVSGEEFTNEFVSAVQSRHMDSFRQRYRGADMLLIDDIQFIGGKEQTEACFFHTFNELHNASRQIVMTCDQPPASLPSLSERLRSRFSWGLVTHLESPDTTTRKEILRRRAEKEGANLGQDVLDFIAGKINQNMRELEGSLNRVIAYAKLLKTTLTPELAAQALADIGERADSLQVNPRQVISAVSQSFGLSPEDITGKRRSRRVALAREMVMYLLRELSGLSLSEIGREVGSRKAFAVSHACARIKELVPTNPEIKQKLTSIQASLSL
ncbi:MAG: chromosomal replication initiator protein DnaA [Chloroflexota bacterium]